MIKNIQNKEKSKKITIDDLAGMVAKGFSSMEEKFDAKLDSKIDGMRDEMIERFDQVDKRLDRIEGQHGHRLDNLENRTVTLKNHMETGFKKKLAW